MAKKDGFGFSKKNYPGLKRAINFNGLKVWEFDGKYFPNKRAVATYVQNKERQEERERAAAEAQAEQLVHILPVVVGAVVGALRGEGNETLHLLLA